MSQGKFSVDLWFTETCRGCLAEERTDLLFPASSSYLVCQENDDGDDGEKKQLAIFYFEVVTVQAIMSFAPGI